MPAIILRFLPHIAIALAIIGAIFFIDHRGYQRAQADQAKLEARIAAKITDAVDAIDKKTAVRIADIDTTQRTIVQPVLTREILANPRLSDPDAGITPAMRDAINAARAESGK